ncbi:MAG: sigma-70 family RNA polymerase sigma factor [Clostridia bacterium]|nr:sigma-70 family RNA polymerase sigma factor [Clostridia bacterium]
MSERENTVQQNLGLVHACAKRFKGRGIEYDDLFQAGCLGLLKAVDNFDEERGFKFSTYAVPVIIGEMKRLFRDGGAVKVSRSLKELSLKAVRESAKFVAENGREPSVSELAQRLDAEPEQVSQALSASQMPVSLTVSDDDGESQTDIPIDAPDEHLTELLSLKSEINNLPERDKNIIILRFFKNNTQSQTAEKLGMTQVQVSRRERKILLALREKLTG